MRFLHFCLLFLFLSFASFAQFNDTINYHAGIDSKGTINSTATSRSYILSNAVKFGIRTKSFSSNFYGSWLYGEQDRVQTNDDYNATLNFNLYKTFPKFYYWGLANFTSSYSLKVNTQYQGGLGIAYSIMDTKKTYLNFSDGVLYEYSDLQQSDSVTDVYYTFRNSFRLAFKFVIKDLVTINGMGFYQNSLSNSKDYIIKSNVGLKIKLIKWVSIGTTLNYNRFNRTGRENLLFQYGLDIDAYF